jgi:hypothetical protein
MGHNPYADMKYERISLENILLIYHGISGIIILKSTFMTSIYVDTLTRLLGC